MKQPGFFQGVGMAAILATAAAALTTVAGPLLGVGFVSVLLTPALGLAYLLFLFRCNPQRTGRVTTFIAWAVVTLVAWMITPSLLVFLLVQVAAIWLVRSLYFYSGVVPAMLDFALCGLALVISFWAFFNTGSVFLAVWSFFLVQAAFVAIPKTMAPATTTKSLVPDDGFECAARRADAALRELMLR